MRSFDNIVSENNGATSNNYAFSQKEWSDAAKVNLNDRINLSAISISYCYSLLKRIKNGTSVLVGFSIVGGLFAIGAAIFSLGFSVHGFYLQNQTNEGSSSSVKEIDSLTANSNVVADSKLSEEWNQFNSVLSQRHS